MFDRLRLLPTLMLCAVLLLGYKVVDIASGNGGSFSAISPARANEAPVEAEKADTKKADAEAQAAAMAAEAQAKSEAEKKTGGVLKNAESGTVLTERPSEAMLGPSRMSEAEIVVLESLSARRAELDKRAKDMDTREQLLAAAEKRVEDRIEELKGLEKRISARLGEVDQETNQQLASVVKMYEGMKPKDAARIFERLDMGVLVDVARRMNPRNMSAVLAAMDPVTAQELTVELATGKMTGDEAPVLSNGPSAPAPAPQAANPGQMPPA